MLYLDVFFVHPHFVDSSNDLGGLYDDFTDAGGIATLEEF